MTVCPQCQAPNEDTAGTCFTCGRSLSAVITRGQVIASRYEILEPLGTGGMGAVYLAHDRELDEKVAIKVLRIDLARSGEMATRFRQEIKLARRVRHKNVCGIHEYGDERGLRFIAMEYIAGTDLRKILERRGRLPLEEAVAVTVEIAEGLNAIHEAGIVHRDLKTANVMVDARGRVRLMDFGIAKQVDAGTGATATGTIIGTPEYMSPEQIRGARVDGRSDVYALGVVFFELLTGDVPFRGDTTVATLMQHLRDAVPLDRPPLPAVPAPIRALLSAMLAKEPDARVPGADAIVRALRDAQTRLPGGSSLRPPAVASEGALALAPLAETAPSALPATAANPRPTSKPAAIGGNMAAAGIRGGRSTNLSLAAGGLAVLAGAALVGLGVTTFSRTPPAQTPPAASPLSAAVPSPTPNPGPIPNAAPPPTPEIATTRPVATPQTRERPTPRPSPAAPVVSPAAAAAPSPSPLAAPSEEPALPGLVRVVAIPWAMVSVDGVPKGTTPFPSLSLPAGSHRLVFKHPAYEPVERALSVRPGEVVLLKVDFSSDGVARR